jgi:hypothetical protein
VGGFFWWGEGGPFLKVFSPFVSKFESASATEVLSFFYYLKALFELEELLHSIMSFKNFCYRFINFLTLQHKSQHIKHLKESTLALSEV